jgi:hypothetical protein
VTTLLTEEQKEGLDRVARKIMKYRASSMKGQSEKERITANTLIRALIESFLKKEGKASMEILASEEDVQKWVEDVLNER